MNALMALFGADSDVITDGEYDGATLKKCFNAFIAFDGAIVTEILDINGTAITRNFITDGTALEAGTLITFDKAVSNITVTGTVVLYGIRNYKY